MAWLFAKTEDPVYEALRSFSENDMLFSSSENQTIAKLKAICSKRVFIAVIQIPGLSRSGWKGQSVFELRV